MSSKLKILPIITIPNPILKKKSAEVEAGKISSKEIQELCLNMEKTMKDKKGVGIAAPQVGKNIRLIIINTKDGGVAMLNPKITKKSLTKEWGEEGCFSVPGVFGQVKRHKKIECEYLDKTGEKIKIKAEGLMARVIQHEIDHLDGILFIDKTRVLKNAH